MGGRPPGGLTASPRLRRVVLALATLLALGATIAIAFAPWLLVEHPLLLLALAPDGADMVLVAGRLGPLPLVLVALPLRILGVGTAFAVGAIYGAPALAASRSSRVQRIRGGLEAILDRFGAPLLVVLPAYAVATLAGAARLPPRSAAPAIVLGQVVAVCAAWFLGDALSAPIDALVAFLREHLVAATLLCAAAVLAWQVRKWVTRN